MAQKDMAQKDLEREQVTERRGGRAKIIALVFVLVLGAFAVWLVNVIMADVKLQNCISSGRRDCAQTVPDGNGR